MRRESSPSLMEARSTGSAPPSSVARAARRPWPFISVAATSLVLGAVSLIYPFGRDQGIFAYVADSLLAGRVMYRDVLDIKPPLTALVNAVALLLFGHSMTAIRVLDLLWTLATALTLCLFVRRAFRSDWTAVIAGCLYPLFYFLLGYWTTAQTDGWLNLPAAGAFVFFLTAQERETRRARQLMLATGLCCGLAVLFKYTIGSLPLVLLLVLFIWRRARLRDAATSAAWLAAGVLVTLLVCAFAFLVSGAMPALIESQFGLVPAYARVAVAPSLVGRLKDLVRGFVAVPDLRLTAIVLAAGVASAWMLYRRRTDSQKGLWLGAAWLFAAFGSAFSQGKFYIYHYLSLLPVAALAGALATAALFERLKRGRRLAGIALAAALVLVSGLPARFGELFRIASGRESVRDYWTTDPEYEEPSFSLRDDIELSDYVRQSTLPPDQVFIWGFEPAVYFLARRNTGSRFIYDLPLIVDYDRQRLRAELVLALVRRPVELFIVEHGDSLPWATGVDDDSYGALRGFPELAELVVADYHPETTIGRFDVLRRNNSARP
jgi:hypothetical protein